jgi:uracil-DNA glycosylase
MESIIVTCEKCLKVGLCFKTTNGLKPNEYLLGSTEAKIWLVGLNPKLEEDEFVERGTSESLNLFTPENSHSYFDDYKKVSKKLYNAFQNKKLVAHTDLVKCATKRFPPTPKKKEIEFIIDNCKQHLIEQIITLKPRIIVCNGSATSWAMLDLFKPKVESVDWKSITSYKTEVSNNNTEVSFWVILSGFIGRIDDRNKRRLGLEIENIASMEGIEL